VLYISRKYNALLVIVTLSIHFAKEKTNILSSVCVC
jgi:hypothetical protein